MNTKIFDFKGLWQNGRRMDAPLGYFRRFTNSFKDRTGRIVPFGLAAATGLNQPVVNNSVPPAIGWGHVLFSAVFKKAIIQIIHGKLTVGPVQVGRFKYIDQDYNDLDVSQPFNSAHQGFLDMTETTRYLPAGNFTSAIVNNKMFICEYVDRTQFEVVTHDSYPQETSFAILKFDGIQVVRAGLPTPWRLSYNPTTAGYPNTNTRRIRYCYMTLDFSGELVLSNYVEEGLAAIGAGTPPSAGDWYYVGGFDTATSLILADQVGVAPHVNGVGIHYPKSRDTYDRMPDFAFKGRPGTVRPNYYPKKWCLGDTYNSYAAGVGANVLYDSISTDLMVGDWLMFTFPLPIRGQNYDCFSFRVKTINTATKIIVFDHKFKGFSNKSVSWEDLDLDTFNYSEEYRAYAPTLTFAQFMASVFEYYLTNLYCLVSQSDNAAGSTAYNLKQIIPICWGFPSILSIGVTAVTYAPFDANYPLFGVITSDFSAWYDINYKKVIFPPVIGITQYKNLLVGFDREALYFSDTTIGGSSEMVNGLSNLVPGGQEFGPIKAICGSERFLVISREFKNYVIAGDIALGATDLIECDEAVAGAENAGALSNAFSDKVLLMNKQGIFAISATGQVVEISQSIRDLFLGNSIDGNLFDRTVMKTDSQRITSGYDGGAFKIAIDSERGFVLFHTGKLAMDGTDLSASGSNILIFDTKDGTWYEFTGNSSSSVEVIQGKIIYLGTNLRAENGTVEAGSAVNEKQILAMGYLTMGEPSFQKKVTQVKVFGNFLTEDGNKTITIQQQNDYAAYSGEKVTDVVYNPASDTAYEHKQRLDSSVARATSVILSNPLGGGIHVEGIEIEMSPLQGEMKK